MKKLSKVIAVLSMTAVAFTTFSCANNAKYEAEKNIQGLCPELKKSIKKDVKSEEDAQALIGSIIQESMEVLMQSFSSSFTRGATAKNPDAAKKQLDKFYKDICALDDCFDDQGNLIKDLKFNGSLDIANLGFEDTASIFIAYLNDAKFKRIDANDHYPTPEAKAQKKKQAELTLDKIKEAMGDDTYDLLDESVKFDRLFLKADFLLKDKDNDKYADYVKTTDEAMLAASIKNLAKIVQCAVEEENNSSFSFPLKAIAVSEEFKGDLDANFTRSTDTIALNSGSLATDSQVSLAAVNKNGLGAYITIKVDTAFDKATLQTMVNALKSSIENDENTLSTINGIAPSIGKITFIFNNGKKDTYKTELSIADIIQIVANTMA